MVEATPMPTVAEEWQARFKLRIIERLMVPGGKWTREQAIDAAQMEWDALSEDVGENAMWGLDEDPAACADECMSYWDDDGDDST